MKYTYQFFTVIVFSCFLITLPSQAETSDPLEGFNRKIFWFNERVDDYVLGPISRGYTEYVPQSARTGVKNFFRNLSSPVYIVSDLLQGNFSDMGTHTVRFLMNSTVGIVGIFDVAESEGFEFKDEDIGQAFGSWGIGGGPYLVLPILGPSNVRDLFGKVGDFALEPLNYPVIYPAIPDHPYTEITFAGGALYAVSLRAGLENAITSAKESSVDYYAFTREAYTQYRNGAIKDSSPTSLDDDEE